MGEERGLVMPRAVCTLGVREESNAPFKLTMVKPDLLETAKLGPQLSDLTCVCVWRTERAMVTGEMGTTHRTTPRITHMRKDNVVELRICHIRLARQQRPGHSKVDAVQKKRVALDGCV